MSDDKARPTAANESSRPQTVVLTKTREENNSCEEDTSIGEAFFSKQNDRSDENNDNLTPKTQADNGHAEVNQSATENSPKLRPKTVTKSRTDGYQQRLVDIGAVNSNEAKPSKEQSLSPKPKSDKCYICGKEFLLSSLKVHEKQCAKKHENEKTSKVNKCSARVSKVSKKPQLEACYLCGKEFFVHSLGIHETQCIKNWKADKTPNAQDQTVSERTILEMMHKESADEPRVDSEPKSTKKDIQTKDQSASPKTEKRTSSPGVKQTGLKTIPCCLCGVAYLPHSLKIHERKCRAQSQEAKPTERNMTKKDKDLNSGPEITIDEEPQGLENETNSKNIDDAKSSSSTFISKKPRTIVCYICGQEFLKSSYAFHEKKCASVNDGATVEETPLESNKVSTPHNSMKPKTTTCYICGEEFLKSSYAFHEKKCIKMAENVQEKEATLQTSKANANTFKTSTKPRTIVCYICGQEFLKSSYAFHEKQCTSKGKKVEDSESLKEKTTTSKVGSTVKEKPSSDLGMERAETPRRKPNTKSCYLCGKEVLISSLKVHEQQCQKKTDILKNINQQKSPAQNRRAARQSGTTVAKPKTEVCYICGETFLSTSIKVHEAQCEKRWNEKA